MYKYFISLSNVYGILFFFFESIDKKICLIMILIIVLFLMDFNEIIKLFYYF